MRIKKQITVEVDVNVPDYGRFYWGCFFKRLNQEDILKVFPDGVIITQLRDDDDFLPCTKEEFDAAYEKLVQAVRRAFLT